MTQPYYEFQLLADRDPRALQAWVTSLKKQFWHKPEGKYDVTIRMDELKDLLDIADQAAAYQLAQYEEGLNT